MKKRAIVHVTTPDTACGYIGHMTAHQLKEITIGANFSAACPACGQVHLSREEIRDIEKQRLTATPEYRQLIGEALADDNS
jgi:Zn-finger nucleic acid-binding protein